MNILQFDNHPLSDRTLHPRKQKVELLYIYNHATVIRLLSQIYRAFGPLGEKLDFSDPWNLKLNETLITKPTN